MKFLKTVLLSSALMIGATFGSNETLPAAANIAIVKTDGEVFAETLETLYKEQDNNLKILKLITGKLVGEEEIVVTEEAGVFLSYLKTLSRRLNVLIKERKELESAKTALVAERDGLKTQLDDVTSAKDRLEKEKVAVERELGTLKSSLEKGIDTLAAKAKELETATQRVVELEEALRVAKDSAREADEAARARIEQLTTELQAATERAEALKTEVDRLTAANADLTARATNAEATALRLKSTTVVSAATRAKLLAAAAESDSDDDNSSENDPLIVVVGSTRNPNDARVATDDTSPRSLSSSFDAEEEPVGAAPLDVEAAARQQRIAKLQALLDLPASQGKGECTSGEGQTHTTKAQRSAAVAELATLGVTVSAAASPVR